MAPTLLCQITLKTTGRAQSKAECEGTCGQVALLPGAGTGAWEGTAGDTLAQQGRPLSQGPLSRGGTGMAQWGLLLAASICKQLLLNLLSRGQPVTKLSQTHTHTHSWSHSTHLQDPQHPRPWGWQRQEVTSAGTHATLSAFTCTFADPSKQKHGPSVCPAPWALSPSPRLLSSPAGPA